MAQNRSLSPFHALGPEQRSIARRDHRDRERRQLGYRTGAEGSTGTPTTATPSRRSTSAAGSRPRVRRHTPTVARHRLFVWLRAPTLPDHQLIVIARPDAYAIGVLHSRVHELWTLRMCTWLGVGNDPRYTPTSTFETFPFPWPLDTSDADLTQEQRRHRDAIASAAEALDRLRSRWLEPRDADPKELAGRTLTRLYNGRPTWLVDAHGRLDAAVLAAYGWPMLGDEELLARLLDLNLSRPAAAARARGTSSSR